MSRKIVTTVLLAAVLTGCSQIIGVPSATTVPLTPQSIAGIWTRQDTRNMKVDTPDITYTLTMQLNADGTYVQTLNLGGGKPPIVNNGTWAMSGAHINLANILVESWDFDQGSWRKQQEQWWFVDQPANKPPIALYGGLKSALETFGEFTRVR